MFDDDTMRKGYSQIDIECAPLTFAAVKSESLCAVDG